MQLRCKLGSGHLGHDLVGENEIEALRIGMKRSQSGGAVLKADRLVTEAGQHLLSERDQRRFIIHEQDSLALAKGRCSSFALPVVARHLLGLRKVGFEGAARTEPAAHVQCAAVLRDDAVDAGKPEAGASARPLGGEERLENPLHDRRVHAGAVIGHGETDIAASRQRSVR